MHLSFLFPPVSKDYEGSKASFYFLVLIAVISTGRSLIHIFSPDGGANSIAGIAIDVEGGTNLIAMFAQWGASQLILALIYWLAILRYRFLTPFMLTVVLLEQLLRLGVGQIKPLVVASPPPGAIGSYILIPVTLIALVFSLKSKSKPEDLP
jgi:hypothetical protein